MTKRKSDAPEIWLKRTDDGFTFASPLDRDTVAGKYGVGTIVRADLTKPRSAKQDRFYWALLRAVLENQETYRTVEALHKGIKVRFGMIEKTVLHNGDVLVETESVSYNAMDGGAFTEHVNRTLDLVCSEIIPGLDRKGREGLMKRVHEMLGPLA